MKEVPVMDFATLRNRLPKEITDDVVQLLANSKEAYKIFITSIHKMMSVTLTQSTELT